MDNELKSMLHPGLWYISHVSSDHNERVACWLIDSWYEEK